MLSPYPVGGLNSSGQWCGRIDLTAGNFARVIARLQPLKTVAIQSGTNPWGYQPTGGP